jgi:hypothetical protein
MNRLYCAVLAGLVVALASWPVTGQTLGEIARKERDRRQTSDTKGSAAKVYTNDDLKPVAAPAAPAPATTTPASASAGSTEQKAKAAEGQKPAEDEKGESYWRARIAQVREDLRRNELFRDSLQTRINSLSNDFAARDDPGQRAQIANDRQTALNELARVSQQIEQDRKQIADIEEEARQAGVPPGWLR